MCGGSDRIGGAFPECMLLRMHHCRRVYEDGSRSGTACEESGGSGRESCRSKGGVGKAEAGKTRL